MLVALELVVAGACRSQQNRIASLRFGTGQGHRTLQRFAKLQTHGAIQMLRNLLSSRTDQERSLCLRVQTLPQNRVVTAFVFAAEDDP